MTPVLVLCILLCAASAASAEGKILPAGAEFQQAEEPEARCTSCPSEWYLYSGVCYKAFTDSRSWFDAAENCSSFGAHLASVPSAFHYTFLQQLSNSISVRYAWLGGLYVQDQWIWIDGDRFIYDGSYYSGTDYASEPCIYLGTTRGWTKSVCSTSRNYICAKRSGC